MQATAALLHRSNTTRKKVNLDEDEEETLTRAESLAVGQEEQRKLDSFWQGIKQVVDAQSARKPHLRFRDLNLELARKNRKVRQQLVIRPEHPVKIFWDIVMFGLTIYSVVMAFYSIGFSAAPSETATNFGYFVTIMFGCDIILSFNTGYINEETGQFIADRAKIAKKYFQFWFWVDFVATIPFDAILPLFVGNTTNVTAIRMIRFIRILRIAKIYKVLDKDGFISRLKINPQLLQLVILIIELFFVAHVFACFWHFLALPENCDTYFENWLDKFGYRQAIESDRYVTSLYFIIVTMLTVGYGDIYPTNQLERIYTIFTMITGVIVFSTLMSKVAALIDKLNPQAKLQAERMEELKAFIIEINLPRHLREMVKEQYEYYYEKKALLDEVGITDLARPMLMTLLDDLYNEDIHEIRLFQEFQSRTLIFYLASKWQPFYAVAGDVLYEKGDVFRKLILIKTGRIRLANVIRAAGVKDPATISSMTSQSESQSVKSTSLSSIKGTAIVLGGLYDGDMFGDMEYCKGMPSLVHYSAVIHCHLFAVDHSVLNQLMGDEQELGEQLNTMFETRYHTMMNLLRDTHLDTVRFQRSIIRLKNLKNDRLERYAGACQKKLYLNGRKVYCDRYFHDFMEVSEKDGEDGLKLAVEASDRMSREEGFTTLTNDSQGFGRSDGIEEEEEKEETIKVLIPNPLLQVQKPTESFMRVHNRGSANNLVANNKVQAEKIVVELPLSTLRERFLIHPYGDLKTIWDLIIAIVVIISVLIIPIQIAFLFEAFPGIDIFNYTIICFFGVDMFITFRTIIESPNNDAFILSPKEIAINYFKGWFIIDLLSTLPFNVIALFTSVDSSTLVLFQLLRFLRLLWLFKLKRVAKTIEYYQDYFGISPVVVKLFTLLFKVYFIVHIMACIWWGVSSAISAHPWYENSGPDGFFAGRLTNVHVSAQYLMSLYFTFTTMSTVGYGDIRQVNPAERTLAIPYLIFSASVFGFMLATVSAVMNSMSASDSIATDKIALITEYLKEKKCTKDLQDQIIYYFQRHYKEDTGYNIDSITERLPDNLTTEILSLFYHHKLQKISFFRFITNKSIQIYLFRLLKPVFYEANCYVIMESEELNTNIYFLTAGQGRVFRRIRNTHKIYNGSGGGEGKRPQKSVRMSNVRDEVIEDTPRDRQEEGEDDSPPLADQSHDSIPLDFTSIYPRNTSSYIPVNSTPDLDDPNTATDHSYGNAPQLLDSDSSRKIVVAPLEAPPSLMEPSKNGQIEMKSRPGLTRDSTATNFTPNHKPEARRSSIAAKEEKIKLHDALNDYSARTGKAFVNFTTTDFMKIGFKYLGDLTSGDFFGYSHYMKAIESPTSMAAGSLFETVASPPRLARRKRNTYSIKTSLETSFLVLEKGDLMTLVRKEPLIAMQLQMALAKSISIQENQKGKTLIENSKQQFVHHVKKVYLKKKVTKARENYGSDLLTHLNTQRNRRRLRRVPSEDHEDSMKALEASANTLRGKMNRYFSSDYKQIRKMAKRMMKEINIDYYEGNWETKVSGDTIANRNKRRQSFKRLSFAAAAAAAPPSTPRSPRSPRKRRPKSSEMVPKRLKPRSYSLNDLELYASLNYPMKDSFVRMDVTSPREIIELTRKKHLSLSQQHPDPSVLPDGKLALPPPPAIGILSFKQSSKSLRISPVGGSSAKRKSVTFNFSDPKSNEEQNLKETNKEGSLTTEVIIGISPEKVVSMDEEVEDSEPKVHPLTSRIQKTTHDGEMKNSSEEDESGRSIGLPNPIDISSSVPDSVRGLEQRPRSYSFPFTGYQRWKLYQSKQLQL